jgi:homoserine dehydrogenase
MSAPVYRIGMLGGGTVGGGVYELLRIKQRTLPVVATAASTTAAATAAAAAAVVVVSKICVRDLTKPRDFDIDTATTALTTDPMELLSPDIDCVVEVAGGCDVAKDVVLKALELGKTVVTANKALLFEHMSTIEHVATGGAASAGGGKPQLGYEAAVCGGIPIVDVLTTGYAGDTIQSVAGICNGTTNYMLSAMAKDPSVQYADVLREAQDLGYAEADPTADVEGHDVRAKIAILAKLAFGVTVPMDKIPCTGISQITSIDFAAAKANHRCTIKLIGTAARGSTTTTVGSNPSGVCVYVTPTLVPLTNQLANVHGCGNCVTVTSKNMGQCTYAGPGAGRYPTANSIVADIYRAAAHALPTVAFPIPNSCLGSDLTVVDDYVACFFIRIPCQTPVSFAALGAIAEECGLALASIEEQDGSQLTLTTSSSSSRSAVDKFCKDVQEKLDFVTGSPLFMPILSVDEE